MRAQHPNPRRMGPGCFCYCLGIAPGASLLNKSTWLLQLIGAKAPPAARDTIEVAFTWTWCWYPQTGNGGHRWSLSRSLSRIFRPGQSHGCCLGQLLRYSTKKTTECPSVICNSSESKMKSVIISAVVHPYRFSNKDVAMNITYWTPKITNLHSSGWNLKWS